MILLIGLDGYSWSWAGKLRARRFAVAPLLSPQPVSWLSWNTLGTGVDASTWGLTLDPRSYSMFGRSRRQRPRYLWEHLEAAGKQSVIVNWPFLIGPQMNRGVLVGGYPATRQAFVLPQDEQERWSYDDLDMSNEYDLAAAGPAVRQRLLMMEPETHVVACAERRLRLTDRFIAEVKRHEPTLAFLGIMDLDRLCHYAYRAMQDEKRGATIIASVLGAIDNVVEALKPEATIICSDHGLDCSAPAQGDGRGQGHDVGLPDSLRGVLALKDDGCSLPSGEAEHTEFAPMVLDRCGVNIPGLRCSDGVFGYERYPQTAGVATEGEHVSAGD